MKRKIIDKLVYIGLLGASKVKTLKSRAKEEFGRWKTKKMSVTIPSDTNSGVILGISSYFHDSSAAFLVNGKLVAAAEEERFTRKKHDSGFPVNAIRFCLEFANLSPEEVTAVAYFENPDEKFTRVIEMLLSNMPSQKQFEQILATWLERKLPKCVQRSLRELGIIAKPIFVDHHLSHAASSYFMSGFDTAAILTIDGVGERDTTTIGFGRGNELVLENCIDFPHSIGLLYSAITSYLGFEVNNDEYKVMGLASYGDPERFLPLMGRLLRVEADGSFLLDPEFFCFGSEDRMYTKELETLFGIPSRERETKITQDHMDIAAALQRITEEAVLRILNHLYETVSSENLCISGGVALNSVLNGKILSGTPFKRLFIQPAAGDGGTAIGAAKYVYHTLNAQSQREVMTHSYYGPSFTDEEIKKFLDANAIAYTEFKSERELLETTARLIYDDNVVGWFQGRMEWGPRALGNRSILANPCNPKMKDILNAKVKHREMFRPFAPVVCAEDAERYFEIDSPLPVPADFMLLVYPVREEKRDKLPSITHVDGSGRLQTIRQEQNPLYHALIKEFGKLSGEDMLVNTSFNVRGEPIVCTPQDAFNCMMGTEIDYLVMGSFLIKRSDNLKKENDL